MYNHHQTSARAVLGVLLAATCLLSGCAGAFRLYDENKAKMSAGVREEYVQANVLGLIEVEKSNLDNLLAEVGCCRFRGHRVKCQHGTGGGSWKDGSLRESSSLRQ